MRLKSLTMRLKRKKGREDSGLLFLEGERLVRDAIESGIALEYCVFMSTGVERFMRLCNVLREVSVPTYISTEKEFTTISDTVHSQGILAVARLESESAIEILKKENPVLSMFFELSDPGNLGTILRTTDWFGSGGVFLSKGSVDATNPKVVRASMGSIFRIPIASIDDETFFLHAAKQEGYFIYASTVKSGHPVQSLIQSRKTLVLFGNEAHGLPDEIITLADARVSIPSFGNAESLNVAIAHAIILSHFALRS